MTLLSKKIEEVRARHLDEAGRELAQVVELGARLGEANGRVTEALDDVLEEMTRQRALIHHKIETLAQCVGLMPAPAVPKPLEAVADDGAHDSALGVARRFAPPARPPHANGHADPRAPGRVQ